MTRGILGNPVSGLFQYYLPDGQFQHQISSSLYDSGYVLPGHDHILGHYKNGYHFCPFFVPCP